MTNSMTKIGIAGLGLLLLSSPLYAEDQLVLKTRTDKDSYSTGVDIVRTLRQRGGQIDLDLVIQGMKDGLTGENLLMSEVELRNTLAAREAEIAGRQKNAANQREDTQPKTANIAPNSEPVAQQKQDLPERQNEQGNGSLAQAPSAALASAMIAGSAGAIGDSGSGQRQVRPVDNTVANEQQVLPEQSNLLFNQPAQNGPFLSRRNQARLNVADMKKEMRASVMTSGAGN